MHAVRTKAPGVTVLPRKVRLRRSWALACGAALLCGMTSPAVPAFAQAPAQAQPVQPASAPVVGTVVERITFREAIDRAIARNPTIAQAAADILRADALLRQARAATLPDVSGSIGVTTSHPVVEFNGQATNPRNQMAANLNATGLLFAPVEWAQRAQAGDNKVVAERGRDEVRRQIALATAQAYLAIIAQRRLAEASLRARDTARSHFDLAHQQQEKGSGSKLNELRAQQALSTDEAALEDALFSVYQAQEALGVLIATEGAVDAADEPLLDMPPPAGATTSAAPPAGATATPGAPGAETAPATGTVAVGAPGASGAQGTQSSDPINERADIRLAVARELAAERVVRDSWKDYLPTVTGLFQPQYLNPATLFSPDWSMRAQVQLTVPIFDSGFRAARKAEREAQLSRSQLETGELRRQAASEIRTFSEAVKSAERSLAAARAGASQAQQVVEIVNVAFRAGATTNIEVIDAQREARDADTAAALTENRLRLARLDLLVASGRFP